MFFKKNKDDSDDAEESKKEEVELPDDVKERYAKSGYQESKDLTKEDIYVLFCEKENWPEFDSNSGESNVEKFLHSLNKIGTYSYSNIIFPDKIEGIGKDSRFFDCIFYCTVKIDADPAAHESFHFNDCIFFGDVEVDGANSVSLSNCICGEKSYHSVVIKAQSMISIRKTKASILRIASENIDIFDSELNQLAFCKTGESFDKLGKPMKSSFKRSIIRSFEFDTASSKIALLSITECFINYFSNISSESELDILSVSYSMIDEIILFDIICGDISVSETEVKNILRIQSKGRIFLDDFYLLNASRES
ncbi:MAG: hypothetical protein D3906_07940 [Candidatus Electrothrix sp. AUS1_2]|nr:hypothetical protein [Candidatus Electrothrix sp. AUS1_2]